MRFPATTMVLLGVLLPARAARSDEPLRPPAITVATSNGGSVRAISDPATQTTRIESTATGKVLWSLPGWQRWMFVADDGKHLVTTGCMNLIPVEHDRRLVLFTFWAEGKKVADVTLQEVVPHEWMLRRTVSHYHWGDIEKIDAQGRLVVRRVGPLGGEELRFELATGRRVN